MSLIDEARRSGARAARACKELGIAHRTRQRWQRQTNSGADGRTTRHRERPSHALTPEEEDAIVTLCNSPRYASLPPAQIVAREADEGRYIASESSMYRVLARRSQSAPRGRSSNHRVARPTTYEATGPNQVWTYDITYLPGPVAGQFFYLCMIVDIYSRKIIGWEVDERESSELAAKVVQQGVLKESCVGRPLVLHSDNGSVLKAATLLKKLQSLNITTSNSRPRVSNDNPFVESLFGTCKSMPDYPSKGFSSIVEARRWVMRFVEWYNHEHRHSSIRFVTPVQRHTGKDIDILACRERLYAQAKAANPRRWSGRTRNWTPVGSVHLNPEDPTLQVTYKNAA